MLCCITASPCFLINIIEPSCSRFLVKSTRFPPDVACEASRPCPIHILEVSWNNSQNLCRRRFARVKLAKLWKLNHGETGQGELKGECMQSETVSTCITSSYQRVLLRKPTLSLSFQQVKAATRHHTAHLFSLSLYPKLCADMSSSLWNAMLACKRLSLARTICMSKTIPVSISQNGMARCGFPNR